MIKSKDYIAGSDWWLESAKLPFSKILIESRVPEVWARYNLRHLDKINSVLTPVNKYVLSLYPRPEIISIDNGVVTFRQRTHAEIWIEERSDKTLYALDKCHQRQFYPSVNVIESSQCFVPTYRFYIPWFINKNAEITIQQVNDEDTPFYINRKTFVTKEVDRLTSYVDTEFVDFKIKNTDEFFLKEDYRIINKNTPMYDMSVSLSDQEISILKDDYGQQ